MTRIRRFTRGQRLFHLLLIFAFTLQAASGLARMYIMTDWGRHLADFFGGYQQTLAIHWWVGLFMLALLGVHVLYILCRIRWRHFPQSVYGPDSLLPRFEDIGQAFQHVCWILGISKPPRFDRWGYWEKFDYFAVFWGILVLGGTGIVLSDPVFFSQYMPGWVINVLLWIHRIEAVLAIVHISVIHFFIGHLRRHAFPMDLVMFEGRVALEKIRHERPAWAERLEQKGTSQAVLVDKPSSALRAFYYIFGFSIMICLVYLCVNAVLHLSYIIF